MLSLVDRKRGRPEGRRALDEKREEIIRTTISAHYLKRTRPTVSQLVRDVQTNCMSAGLKPPHRRTIVARLKDIDLQKRAKRRGEQKIVKATTPVPGDRSLPTLGSCPDGPYEGRRLRRRRGDPAAPRSTVADAGDGRPQPDGNRFLSHHGRAVPAVYQPMPVALEVVAGHAPQVGLVKTSRSFCL